VALSNNLINQSVLVISVLFYLSAVAGFLIAFQQLRSNAQTNTASFWLNLRSMFSNHEAVHMSLQTDTSWRDVNRPVTDEEAIAIVEYMGMFEHVYKMLKRKLIDWETFKDIFAYRVLLIVNSPVIVQATLVDNGRWWLTFRQLAKDLGHKLPERADYNLDRTSLGYPAGWGQADVQRLQEFSNADELAEAIEVEVPSAHPAEVEEPAEAIEVEVPSAHPAEVEEPADPTEVEEPAEAIEVEVPSAHPAEVEEPADLM
jgi:hypothetical protein